MVARNRHVGGLRAGIAGRRGAQVLARVAPDPPCGGIPLAGSRQIRADRDLAGAPESRGLHDRKDPVRPARTRVGHCRAAGLDAVGRPGRPQRLPSATDRSRDVATTRFAGSIRADQRPDRPAGGPVPDLRDRSQIRLQQDDPALVAGRLVEVDPTGRSHWLADCSTDPVADGCCRFVVVVVGLGCLDGLQSAAADDLSRPSSHRCSTSSSRWTTKR